MKCKCCGKDIGLFTLDIAYELPDVVWALPENERETKAHYNSDLCQYNDSYYIRGIALIPINETNTSFGWGLWVEVNKKTFNKYLEIYEVDGTHKPAEESLIANTPLKYENANNLKAKIQFCSPNERPELIFEENDYKLSQEQLNGISVERVHALNRNISKQITLTDRQLLA